MSERRWSGHEVYTLGPARGRKPRVVHLRVGADTSFPGPACGIDIHSHHRTGALSALELVDDPARVTCSKCQRSLAFQLRETESP